MPIYNKLVRDHIPEIIENTGKQCSTRVLAHNEYFKELKKKSLEELEEYMNAEFNEEAIEELADLLEVIHALSKYHGATIEQVEEIRLQKAKERGGFSEKIFLIEVE
ncbi:nucleoside triphosphate pyrophosphohydrolase [Heyndrickxia vini]|uniref:Nucleoside triphosphate pyrophosphohydrolase n=1 Tax=Heyndrickxia vini TaxID=1476025 RepID=A0ABX7DW03_9BACI|nr:nucleoside triphosphate pyrophosphohydrolase [Heyndrickxia vini]QQZ07674.1 nucleoside triphosphate pyrophosphohydrolase [Heyndrickxia vini]